MTFLRKTVLWVIVVLVMVVTFYLSNQPAIGSWELSVGITDVVSSGLEKVIPAAEIDWFFLHHTIRKSAHFFIYMILGIFVFLACIYVRLSTYASFWVTMIICVLFAISDEIHQVFIPGRSGEIRDVFIDSIGALLGIFIGLSIKNIGKQADSNK